MLSNAAENGNGNRRSVQLVVHFHLSTPFRMLQARLIPVMGNVSAVIAAAGTFLCCWVHLPGEGARAIAAVPSCALLLMLQDDGSLFRGTGFRSAVPLGALSVAWAGSAAYYIFAKVGHDIGEY